MKAPLLFFLGGAFLVSLTSSVPVKEEFGDTSKYKEKLKVWLKKEDAHRKTDNVKVPQEDIPKTGELFEGDMIMSEDLRDAVLGKENKRSAIRDTSKRWPHNTIPYVFADHVSGRQKYRIERALEDFHKYTCITTKPRTDEDAYVVIQTNKHQCASYVGMQRAQGSQPITLGPGCYRKGTILHEFMHALGIVHEQSRPDRDEYISVKWEHIKRRSRHNFQKYPWSTVSNDGKTYDFSSVMHYGPLAFSKDGYDTLVPKHGEDLEFGQRRALSEGDVYEINTLYNCPDVTYDTSNLVPSTDGQSYEEPTEDEEANEEEDEEESLKK